MTRSVPRSAAVAWLFSAALFLAFMLSPVVDDQLLRAEAGYCIATALLCSLLVVVYRRGGATPRRQAQLDALAT